VGVEVVAVMVVVVGHHKLVREVEVV
jgi:hypothetical protein